jgi:hypothetical protein
MKVEGLIALLRMCQQQAEVRVVVDDHSFGFRHQIETEFKTGTVGLMIDDKDEKTYP